jgi:broad specificity phosphatase PhoE
LQGQQSEPFPLTEVGERQAKAVGLYLCKKAAVGGNVICEEDDGMDVQEEEEEEEKERDLSSFFHAIYASDLLR